MNFGETLKDIRKEHKDSLRTLANKLGVTHSYIQRIEENKIPISKNYFDKILKYYPLQKNRLIKSYLEETLPDEVQKEIGLKIENNFLDDMKNLIKMLDKENQKLAFLYIVERLEVTSIKNGTYDKVKSILEEVKEKINKC